MALMPAARACLVLGKGLSPIWSSMTSFPWALRRLATARTSKAVSAVRPRAKELSVAEDGAIVNRQPDEDEKTTLHYNLAARPAPAHCFAAIAWASGLTTPGTMWLSTSSWQMRR